MSRGRQYIEFENYFAEGILGIYKIISGFAELRDLAVVSVLYELNEKLLIHFFGFNEYVN